jgi:hypothetical protein
MAFLSNNQLSCDTTPLEDEQQNSKKYSRSSYLYVNLLLEDLQLKKFPVFSHLYANLHLIAFQVLGRTYDTESTLTLFRNLT